MIKRQQPSRMSGKRPKRNKSRSLSPQLILNSHINRHENVSVRVHDKSIELSSQQRDQPIKICLELASHHKKEADLLKQKNVKLELRLKERVQDMEELKNQLNNIKSSLQSSHYGNKREVQALKLQNMQLKKSNESLTVQIQTLKKQLQFTSETIFVSTENKTDIEINPLSVTKQSRRLRYTKNYENFSLTPSNSCLECLKKASLLEQQRQRFCQQLKQLQQQVNYLQQSQPTIGVLQDQLRSKDKCIGYLNSELESLEANSEQVVRTIVILEQRLELVKRENLELRGEGEPQRYSFSKLVI